MLVKFNKVTKSKDLSARLFKNSLGTKQHLCSDNCVHSRNWELHSSGQSCVWALHIPAGTQSDEAATTV